MIGRPVTLRIDRPHSPRGRRHPIRQHDAVEADLVAEGDRGVHRVLADHRVDDEEDLVGMHGVADVHGSAVRSASTPSRPAVSTITTSYILRVASSIDARAIAIGRRRALPSPATERIAGLLALIDCTQFTASGVVGRRDQQAGGAVLLQPAAGASSPRPPCLSGGLPAWMTVGGPQEPQRVRVSPPRISTSCSLTILTICCVGFSATLGGARLLFDARHEVFDHAEVDVGLQQRDANLARDLVDIGLESRPHPEGCGRSRSGGLAVGPNKAFTVDRSRLLQAGKSPEPGGPASLPQQAVDEALRGERGEVVGALAEPDQLHRDAQLVLHLHDDAAFADPSSLLRTSPVTSTTSEKMRACTSPFWPVVASITSSTGDRRLLLDDALDLAQSRP